MGFLMKDLINFSGKVCFSGIRYDDTRLMNLNELVLRMEVDFEKLAVKLREFGVFFKVATRSHKYGLHEEIVLRIIANDQIVLNYIKSDVISVLDSYNRQIFIRCNGRYVSYYLRYSYRIEYLDVKKFYSDQQK